LLGVIKKFCEKHQDFLARPDSEKGTPDDKRRTTIEFKGIIPRFAYCILLLALRFATVVGDGGHIASKNGLRAVVGSKRLKAVVVYREKRGGCHF
jgi:hypothetical protein